MICIVLQISRKEESTKYINCGVGGADIDFLIDHSGSSCNLISEQVWKVNKIKYIEKNYGASQQLFGYALKVPLKIWGKFKTTIKVLDRE